tara:strand:+ start:3222 stop:3809 length:588 start_codon:yes stop_codon:yes gene_type:complete
MMPLDAYKCYLAMKNHFTKDNYDYHKYAGKVRATREAFYKRKDRFWFEKFSRQKNDKEVVDFFVSNFVSTTDPSTMWIGEMIKEGEDRYTDWKKKVQSLSYVFREEVNNLFNDKKVDDVFDCSRGHPPILKSYLGGDTSLETMVICDRIFEYGKDFDERLKDPVWETVSRKIKKYDPFLNINVPRYKKILKEIIL